MALFRRKKVETDDEAPVDEVTRLPGTPGEDAFGRRPIAAQRDYLVSLVKPLSPFGLSITDAHGLALCENVPAPEDVPHETTAAIDGYALASSSTRFAGRPDEVRVQVDRRPPSPVTEGTAVLVMAGARLPRGTDAVASASHMDADGELVFTQPLTQWSGCRLAGTDFLAGETLLHKGTTIHAGSVALLANAGVDKVLARPRPRVVVIGTGGGQPGEGVPTLDTTARTVAAAAHVSGAHVWRVEADGQDLDALRETVTDQLIRADLVLATSDRMVPGDRDPVSVLLPELGATDFCQVAMAPGSLHGFGLVGPDETPLLVLPTGPGAALASFHAFALPMLRAMAGVDAAGDVLHVPTTVPFGPDPELTTFCPVRLVRTDGHLAMEPVGTGDITHVPSLAAADAIAVVEPGLTTVGVGTPVDCWPLSR